MSNVAGRQLERIARGGSLSLAGAGASAAANFLVVVVITNGFSKAEAGSLFSASSVFLLVLALSGLGIEAGLGRFMLKYVVERRWMAARECLRNTGLVTLVVSLLATIAMLVWAPQIASLAGLDSLFGAQMLRILAAGVALSALGNWALFASRAFANIRQTVAIDKIFRAFLQLALVGLCVWLGSGLASLTWAWMLPTALMAPLAIWGLRAVYVRAVPRGEELVAEPGAIREFWRFTAPRSIAQISQMVVQRADIIIIAALMSAEAAAVYTAATRFVPLGQLGVQAVQQVVQPRFTHLLATGEREALREVFRTTTAWNIAMSWPVYLVIGSMAGLYLQIFGSGFAQEGLWVVLIMMVAMLFGVASGPVDTLLLMSGRSWLSLGNALASLAVSIGGCFLLIPRMGITGAALAWCGAIVTKSLLGYLQLRRYERLSPVSRGAAVVALASFACFGVPGAALSITGLLTLLSAIVVACIGAAAYLFMLWFARDLLRLSALRSLLPSGPRGGKR